MMRGHLYILILLLCASAAPAENPAPPGAWIHLIDGRQLTGWTMRQPAVKQTWEVVAVVTLDPNDPARLFGADDGLKTPGTFLNGGDGRGTDLLTELTFGDCELQLEFMVPRGSNSGIYLMGLYEVQILDSFARPDDQLKYGDCGGIYDTRAPSTNACREPGKWQKFEILFRAPRFDAAGTKTASARFLSVKLNGVEIQKDVEVKGPTTSALPGPERDKGPILLQGDHGPVAFRAIRVRDLR